jgi:TolA-binding protein
MKPVWSTPLGRWSLLAGGAAAIAAASLAPPLLAQADPTGTVEGRVYKLEKEMRAVQRKIFPGGAGATLEPEIQAPASAPAEAGTPATSPIVDLGARVDALERQVAQITGQVEQAGYTNRQLQDQIAKMKSDYDYRLSALEKGGPIAADTPPTAIDRTAAAAPPAAPPAPPAAAPAAAADNAEDAYMAGYRLWVAKKYPEAEAALKAVVAKYPDSSRASYAQNLLGRSYLDEGKPGLAAEALLKNYQTMPKGERAPDSLYYLGQALMKLKKPADACKAYGELDDVYGAKLGASLKAKLAQARADARCG